MRKEVPPVDVAYQLIVPAEATAPKVAGPDSQTIDGVVDVIVGIVLIVAITGVLVEMHPAST